MEKDGGRETGDGVGGEEWGVGWGMVGEYIQWAKIDRVRKRWMVGGKETVRHSAGYIVS